jgi:hypothetical protein
MAANPSIFFELTANFYCYIKGTMDVTKKRSLKTNQLSGWIIEFEHTGCHQAAYAYIFLFLTKTVSKPPKDRGDSQMKVFFWQLCCQKMPGVCGRGLLNYFVPCYWVFWCHLEASNSNSSDLWVTAVLVLVLVLTTKYCIGIDKKMNAMRKTADRYFRDSQLRS